MTAHCALTSVLGLRCVSRIGGCWARVRCTCVDERGWRGCRGTDLRGRPGSCPTLSRYTIILLAVCALVSLRGRFAFSTRQPLCPFAEVPWSAVRLSFYRSSSSSSSSLSSCLPPHLLARLSICLFLFRLYSLDGDFYRVKLGDIFHAMAWKVGKFWIFVSAFLSGRRFYFCELYIFRI